MEIRVTSNTITVKELRDHIKNHTFADTIREIEVRA